MWTVGAGHSTAVGVACWSYATGRVRLRVRGLAVARFFWKRARWWHTKLGGGTPGGGTPKGVVTQWWRGVVHISTRGPACMACAQMRRNRDHPNSSLHSCCTVPRRRHARDAADVGVYGRRGRLRGRLAPRHTARLCRRLCHGRRARPLQPPSASASSPS